MALAAYHAHASTHEAVTTCCSLSFQPAASCSRLCVSFARALHTTHCLRLLESMADAAPRKRGLGEVDAAAEPLPSGPGSKKLPSFNPLNGAAFSANYFKLRETRLKLPVSNFLDDLEAKLRAQQVVIVEGETGSGKTTQVSVIQALSVERLRLCAQAICVSHGEIAGNALLHACASLALRLDFASSD